MRVLVTGAGGFVGAHVVRLLLREGAHVFAGSLDVTPPSDDLRRATWIPLDLTSTESVATAVEHARPDHVVHLAAWSSLAESAAQPLQSWDVNATGTLRLLSAVPRGTRFVLASSAQVYGFVPEEEQPLTEDRPVRPLNLYAAGKAAAEILVQQATREGRISGVIARSFNHAGVGQSPRFALPDFARQIAAAKLGVGEPVLRVGDLRARRDFTDVRDAARAYHVLATRGESGETYNICSGRAWSLRELLDLLIEISGVPVRVEVDGSRLRSSDLPLLSGDNTALRVLGWRPREEMRETLRELLEAMTAELSALPA